MVSDDAVSALIIQGRGISMKKFTALFLSAMMFISLSGCKAFDKSVSTYRMAIEAVIPDAPDFSQSAINGSYEFNSKNGEYTLAVELHSFYDYSPIIDYITEHEELYDTAYDELTEDEIAAAKAEIEAIYEQMEADADHYYVFRWQEEDGLTEPVAFAKTENTEVFEAEWEYVRNEKEDVYNSTHSDKFGIHWMKDEVKVKFEKNESDWKTLTFPYPDRTVRTQTAEWEYNNEEKPEVTGAILTADCYGELRNKAEAQDVYDIYVYPSRTVGLIGVPVLLEYYDSVQNPSLTLTYDENELRGTPETSIIAMFHDDAAGTFTELPEAVVDTENNTVTIPDAAEGIYLLVDVYQWDTRWSTIDPSIEPRGAYESDKTDYESNWERLCYTGDIMELADKEWVKAQDGEFHVTTPEQLAGAVYYANVLAEYYETVYIILEDDIDLAGYDWAPMGWREDGTNSFAIYGQGHTISNMTINMPEEREAGFIGYTNSLRAYDITFENASVTADSYAGVLCGVAYMTDVIENVSVSGTVDAGDRCGSIIGDESGGIGYKNCTADVLVNGEEFPYFSYLDKLQDELSVYEEEIFHISIDENYCITRDEHDGYENLGWEVFIDDMPVLSRNARNETVFDTRTNGAVGVKAGCKYTVYLTAWKNGGYVRVSNVLEYTVPDDYSVTASSDGTVIYEGGGPIISGVKGE